MNEAAFTKHLSSVLLDNKYDRFVKGKKSGKLDTRSLYKVDVTNKLFKKREERKNKNYAVSLVVDCSGSMGSGGKMRVAAQSAEKLSKALSAVGVPHNIITFHCDIKETKPFGTAFVKNISKEIMEFYNDGYAVFAPTKEAKYTSKGIHYKFIEHIKSHQWTGDYRMRIAKENGCDYSGVYASGSGDNNDGAALRFATESIMQQKGRRIVIFLSDGRPENSESGLEHPAIPGRLMEVHDDVAKEVKHTLGLGVELYSIGMMDDSVNRYYPPKRTCAIYDINQLYDHIIKMIKLNLHRG